VAEQAAAEGARQWLRKEVEERGGQARVKELEERVRVLTRVEAQRSAETERLLEQLELVRRDAAAEKDKAVAALQRRLGEETKRSAELEGRVAELRSRLGGEEARAAAAEERMGMLKDRAEQSVRLAKREAVREAAAGAIRVSVVAPVVRLTIGGVGGGGTDVEIRAARAAAGPIADSLRTAVLRRFARLLVDDAGAPWTDALLRELEAAVEVEVSRHFHPATAATAPATP
jgi:hypothetical protein